VRHGAYPSAKRSGIEGLGDVPEHWELKPLGYLVRFRGGATPDKSKPEYWDGDIPWVSPKDMKRPLIVDSEDHVSLEGLHSSPLCLIPPNAVLIVVRGMILAHSFPVALTGGPVTINQDMKALVVLPAVQARFLFWALNGVAKALVSLADESAHGTRKLESSILSRFLVLVPPSREQETIADFLDRETAKLDTLVTKKRALVEKLKEKRTALISRTVTRGMPAEAAAKAGLEPHPKLKPSGIEWLGDVPEHWTVTAVGYQFRNLDHRRIPVAGEDRATVEKTYPYYGASGIIDYVEEFLFDEPLILVAEDGANLLSRSTPLAFLASGKYWVNNHAHILKPVSGDIRYWTAVLQTYDYTPLVTGAAQPKLTSDRLSSIRIPLPAPPEQRAIADFLDCETAKIDRMIAKVEEAVERLEEYRSALITAAVTGKIDVRRAARPAGDGAGDSVTLPA
jgi:type I restriction enzyme S subunit